VREIAQRHLSHLRAQLAELAALEMEMTGFLAACDEACSGGVPADCNTLGALRMPVTSVSG